jgi:hypothetical protein
MAGLGQKLRNLWGRRAGAAQHAMGLLIDNLSSTQRDQLKLFDYFDVVGGDTGTCYCIHFGNLVNVEQLDASGKRKRMLCFMPIGHLPVGDTMLAQKIALELFETEALRTANERQEWHDIFGERPPLGFRNS